MSEKPISDILRARIRSAMRQGSLPAELTVTPEQMHALTADPIISISEWDLREGRRKTFEGIPLKVIDGDHQ